MWERRLTLCCWKVRYTGAGSWESVTPRDERMIFQKGVLKNGNFLDYKMPTIKDVPPVQAVIVETDERDGPFGARDIG